MITDDERTRMPWTRDSMTVAEFEQWVATREEAGRDIDIETCELGRWFALDMDPYGIREARGEEPYPQVGTNRFVRSPESRGWVWEGDLPPEKGKAMYNRIRRDRDAYDVIKKKFVEAAATFRLSDETDFDAHIKSSWDVWDVIQGAVREFAGGRGVLDVRTVMFLADAAMEAGIKSRRTRREP
jgi:hypothetical protein